MSVEYDRYLNEHVSNVKKGFYWIRKSLPELLKPIPNVDYELMILLHDDTKTVPSEYDPYDEYFYGKHKKDTEKNFNYAWLEHIHRNPHHWQHWLLRNDDGTTVILDMPYEYIIEMICDWWSFSWKTGDLYAIFDWYEENKKIIKLSKKTRATVEEILDALETKLKKVRGPRK